MFAIIHVPHNLRPTLARLEYGVMQGKVKEEWMQMCEQAAIEQDSEKLMALIMEINRMLDEKEQRLKSGKPAKARLQR
jgi:predicted MarR family transcription regulator